VTVAFSGAAQVEEVVQSAREHKAEDDVRSQLGHRVAVSADGPDVFLSAATEGRAPTPSSRDGCDRCGSQSPGAAGAAVWPRSPPRPQS
jgi:hypothetical protein